MNLSAVARSAFYLSHGPVATIRWNHRCVGQQFFATVSEGLARGRTRELEESRLKQWQRSDLGRRDVAILSGILLGDPPHSDLPLPAVVPDRVDDADRTLIVKQVFDAVFFDQ